MLKIVFDNFKKVPGYVSFNVKTYDESNLLKNDEVYFDLSEPVEIDDNLIAISLSTFCGNKFDEIYFDLSISDKTIKNISFYTQSNVNVSSINNEDFIREDRTKIALNFSGGFDSLAAKILFGDNVELISMHFFDSEYKFFKNFKPYIVKTNFRQLGYADNVWTFMGVGSILYSNFLNIKYLTFGTILEAYHLHATSFLSSRDRFIESPFNFAGIDTLKLIQSMTEIGTALVICNTYPFLANESLNSLSLPRTEKRYRKQLILQILKKKFNLDNILIELTEAPPENARLTWGNDYALDFLNLYILKHAGYEETSKIMKNIPQVVVDFVNNNSLDFYEKYNPNYLNNIPKEMKSDVAKNLAIAKIFPYNQKDYDDLKKVLEFLTKFHPFLVEAIEKF